MRIKALKYLLYVLPLFLITACHHSEETTDEENAVTKTPVSIVPVSKEPIAENIMLRGTSLFQKKVAVRSNIAGYIENMNIAIGDKVSQGQILFTIKTKEASALENSGIKDSNFNFSGEIKIFAQKSGIITTLDHQKGDYVQEADQLCMISEASSLVFLLEVPFELHAYLKVNTECEIVLPGEEIIKGKVSGSMPTVDALSQTQSYIVQPATSSGIPENLIAEIRFVKSVKPDAIVIPRSALLSDESQTAFWVMKVINDTTAVKVYVKKGIETPEKVEITEPLFATHDKLVLNGNYGLSDTARIMIQKPE